jgi:hypothetical protein
MGWTIISNILNILSSIPGMWHIVRKIPCLRKHQSIPGLEITLSWGVGSFPGVPRCYWLEFIFFNNTGRKVRIFNTKIKDVTPLLKVHPLADRDKKSCSHPLKFIDRDGHYDIRDIVIETNSRVKTALPLAEDYKIEESIKELVADLNSLPNNIKETRYFKLIFIATVGYRNTKEMEINY